VIEPRDITVPAGFETATGIQVNVLPPETAAEWLRRRGNALRTRPGNIFQRLEGRPAEVLPLVAVLERELNEGPDNHDEDGYNHWLPEDHQALVRAQRTAERLRFECPDRTIE
jgi:hypothetical protein